MQKQAVLGLSNELEHLVNLLELYLIEYNDALHTIEKGSYSQVLAIGNTGCGKSTMLVSLIEGTDAIKIHTYFEEIQKTNPDGTKGTKRTRKVRLDMVDGCTSPFKIGHSESESETFLPKF